MPVILAFGGMRLGEALALTWDDVSFAEGTVRITKSAQESKGPITIVEPKTAAGRRPVTLGATAMEVLRRRFEAAESEGYAKKTDLVFPTTLGTPYRKSNLHRRWWAPLLLKAELPRVRIHDIRHSAASLSLLAGTDPKTISAKLGHENPAFTLRVYAHAVEALHRKATEALDSLLAADDSQSDEAQNNGERTNLGS